jgi:type VI secretion system protein ImpF
MADPRAIDGAHSLLFEKLIDLDPKSSADPQVFRVMNLEDLKASIKRELERLIDTRRAVSLDESIAEDKARGANPRTVLDFGIPDWTTLAPFDVAGREAYARAVCTAIKAFEPRLIEPKVELADHLARYNKLVFVITGHVKLGTLIEPVSFPIDFRSVARS